MDRYLIKQCDQKDVSPQEDYSQFKQNRCILPEGLVFMRNFITQEEEKELIQHLDNKTWSNELHRRVQHYGYKYDYKCKKIVQDPNIEPIPDFVVPIINRIMENFPQLSQRPDQIIVNGIKPFQKINC